MIWFLSDYDFSARCWERNADTHTQKEKQGERSPAWVKHQWEELEKVMVCGGEGGMMKRRSSLTFEEPVENVGTTSKRAPWNIQHTTASVAGKPHTSRCAVFQLVVFGPGLAFDIYLHRSDKQRYLRRPCETRAAEIQTCFFCLFLSLYSANFDSEMAGVVFFCLLTVNQMQLCLHPSLNHLSFHLCPRFTSFTCPMCLSLTRAVPPSSAMRVCACVCVLSLDLPIYPSVFFYLACFLSMCVCVCLVDADETVIHDLLRVFLSEDIRSSAAHTHTHTVTHTCRQAHIHTHVVSEEIRESLKVEISFGAWLLLSCRSCD